MIKCPLCSNHFSEPPTEPEQKFMDALWASSPPPKVQDLLTDLAKDSPIR